MDYNLIDSFEDIENHRFIKNPEEWRKCKICGSKPRAWIFYNGQYAACKCFKKYCGNFVIAESINSYAKRNKGNLTNYQGEKELCKNWNYFVESGEIIKLNKDMW